MLPTLHNIISHIMNMCVEFFGWLIFFIIIFFIKNISFISDTSNIFFIENISFISDTSNMMTEININ